MVEKTKCFGPYRVFVFIIACLLMAFNFFLQNCPSMVSKEIAESYEIEESKIWIFSSLFFYPYAILQIIIGPLVDMTDPAILLGCCHILAALSSVICGFSNNLAVGGIGRFLGGISCSPTLVAIIKVVTIWFPIEQFSILVGIVLASQGIGGILAQYPLAIFIEKFGWRIAFYGIGGIDFIFAVLFIIFGRGRPEDRGYPAVNQTNSLDKMSCKEKFKPLGKYILIVIKNLDFWFVSFAQFFKFGTYLDISGLWASPYFQDLYGFSASKTGIILCGFNIGMIIGCFLSPHLSVWHKSKKWPLVESTILAIIILLSYIIWIDEVPFGVSIMLCIFLGMSLGGFSNECFDLIREYFDPEIVSTSTSLANFMCFMGTSVIQNISSAIIPNSGKIVDENREEKYKKNGYRNGLWIFCTVMVAVGLVLLILTKDSEIKEKNDEDNLQNEDKNDINLKPIESEVSIKNGYESKETEGDEKLKAK